MMGDFAKYLTVYLVSRKQVLTVNLYTASILTCITHWIRYNSDFKDRSTVPEAYKHCVLYCPQVEQQLRLGVFVYADSLAVLSRIEPIITISPYT